MNGQRRCVVPLLGAGITLLILLLAMLPTASAQSMTGRVGGTVTDPQSAVVPGATVELINELTQQTRQVVSGGQGEFVFTNVVAATYTVRVNAAGFKAYEQTGIEVSSNEAVALRAIQLEIGTTSETVEVTADVARVETQSSQRAALVTSTQVDTLGFGQNRNYLDMLKLVPGVVGQDINGGQSGQAIVTLDGISIADTGFPIGLSSWISPTVDAISEVKVLLTNYSAEYGVRSGGTVNVAIKNGTREFHGTVYYFKRHEKLNANSWDNNRKGQAKQKDRFNNPGFTVGGPVIIPGTSFNKNRDKLFFFYSTEWRPSSRPSTGTAYFPTDLERNGDFSKTVRGNGSLYVVADPNTGQQFTDNAIPESRANAIGKAFLGLFPSPNRTDWTSDPNNQWNYFGAWVVDSPKDEEILRIDWNVAPKTLIYGRWMRDNTTRNDPSGFSTINMGRIPRFGSTFASGGQGLQTTWIQTFTPNLVNEAVVGFNRGYQNNTAWEQDIEINQITTYPALAAFKQFHPELNPLKILPTASFGGPNADFSVDQRFLFHGINRFLNINDNLSWVKGTHSLKFGMYTEFTVRPSVRESIMNGSFNFSPNPANPLESGLGMANAYLGNVYRYQESDKAQISNSKYRDIEFYAQDSWRATRRLTIDMGLRIQNISPTHWPGQKLGVFDPSLYDASKAMQYIYPIAGGKGKNPITGEEVAGTFVGTYAMPSGVVYTPEQMNPFTTLYDDQILINPGWLLAPRFGFAYDIFGDGKMAIRGGFGMFYDRSGADDVQAQAMQVPPIQNMTTIYFSPISAIQTATSTYAPGMSPRANERAFNAPGSYNWSFGVQRDVGFGVVLDVSYVATVGRHMSRDTPINSLAYGTHFQQSSFSPYTGQLLDDNFLRPYQGYGTITYVSFDDTSNYHSMQMTVNRRFGTRLTLGGNWTWSKVMDYDGTWGPVYNLPRKVNYGLASTDRTHNVVVNWTYRVPGLSSRLSGNPIARQVFDGWQISGIGTFTSGSVSSVTYSMAGGWPPPDSTGADRAPTRIDVVGNPVRSDISGLQSHLNPSAFALPLQGSANCIYGDPYTCGFGNAGKNIYRGGGTNNWDITLFKDFYLDRSETRSLQIRWEMYNAFNHTQLGAGGGGGGFGPPPGFGGGGGTNAATFDAAGNQTNAEFGLYTSAAANRAMVVAAKLRF